MTAANVLSAPTHGGALFVEADRKTIRSRRRIKHHCTRAEWEHPSRRLAKIAEAWALTSSTIRAEGETLICPAPVTLYRHPLSGRVVVADLVIAGPTGLRWYTATGVPYLSPPSLLGLVPEHTTYAYWAEGPLLYMGDHEAVAAPDPYADRDLQRVRHQNAALREKIDAAVAPSLDPIARDAGHPEFIDFRIRGIFERQDLRTIQSKQTGEAAKLILADGTIEIRDHNPLDLTE